MAIRAVFFDWFNTLTRSPREGDYVRVCRDLGYEATADRLTRGLLLADMFYSDENSRSPLRKRNPQEMMAVYMRHEQIILKEAGLPSDEETVMRVMGKLKGASPTMDFALYDDVLPALRMLKSHGLILGLISNIDQDITPLCRRLGVDGYLTHVVTSRDVGSEKPNAPIFMAALGKAGVKAAEAVYVGDQHSVDVVGARGVGMKPVLIDRYDLFPDIVDCVRIKSLTELADHI